MGGRPLPYDLTVFGGAGGGAVRQPATDAAAALPAAASLLAAASLPPPCRLPPPCGLPAASLPAAASLRAAAAAASLPSYFPIAGKNCSRILSR